MNNINEYKKRFYNLMESTLGDVRPLISEQGERPPFMPQTPRTSSPSSSIETLPTSIEPEVTSGFPPSLPVSDLERKELGDKMMKDWIDLHYIDQVFNKEKNRPYRPFNNNGKLNYNMVYREYMLDMDNDLKDLGFPNGFRIPEGITRNEFESLKKKWDDTINK